MTNIIIGIFIGIAIWSDLFAVICLMDKLDEDIAQILLSGVWSLPLLLFEGIYKPIMKIRVYFFNKNIAESFYGSIKTARRLTVSNFGCIKIV